MVFYLKTSYLVQNEGRLWLDSTLDHSDLTEIDLDRPRPIFGLGAEIDARFRPILHISHIWTEIDLDRPQMPPSPILAHSELF